MISKPKPVRVSALAGRFRRDRRGAVAIEYGILLMMVGIAVLGIFSLGDGLGSLINTNFGLLSDTMTNSID